MKMKSQLTLAALIMAGLLATGCSQQQAAGSQQQQAAPATETKTETTTAAPAGSHTHPAIPGCTNSVTHSHASNDPNHTHHYSCKPGVGHVGGGLAIPHVKAKGNYKGPVAMDSASQAAMQQYQQK